MWSIESLRWSYVDASMQFLAASGMLFNQDSELHSAKFRRIILFFFSLKMLEIPPCRSATESGLHIAAPYPFAFVLPSVLPSSSKCCEVGTQRTYQSQAELPGSELHR